MVGTLLLRGILVGIVAGLLAFGFARVFGEPAVDSAIGFEALIANATGEPAEPEVVSRGVQSTLGLLAGVLVYGGGIGGLFALVFAFANGRMGRLSPRAVSLILAALGLVAVILVPQLKYPANPPSVGDPDTIGYRTQLYLLMILISIAAMIAAVYLCRAVMDRHGTWNGVILGGVGFVALTGIAGFFLPAINEIPEQFPAGVLWQFRVSALGMHVIIWAAIGLLLGWWVEGGRQRLPNRIAAFRR